MSKTNLLIATFILNAMLLSCKGNETEKNSSVVTEIKQEIVTDCGCDELTLKDKDDREISKGITKSEIKGLFSGNCIEKDQNDSIIKKLEIKNGFIIREIKRQKVFKKYETILDYTYDYNEGIQIAVNGFKLDIVELDGQSFVKYCKIIKNKKTTDEYEVFTSKNSEGGWSIKTSWETKNSEFKSDMFKPKCMEDAEFWGSYGSSSAEHRLDDISPEKSNEVIKCLKTELPKFNVWKLD